MRADRLLSILMLLQTHGKVSAPQLARELEVSVRTIYRDIDALSTAGVPIYFERGKNGGCSLLEGYRTNLTGLTEDEVKALFILGVPASLDELGVSQNIKTALRKLSASLPASQRHDEKNIRQRVYIDWTGWSHGIESKPHLQTIYQAVWDNRKIHISYFERIASRLEKQFERTVKPYGLVAKSGEWYLVCADDTRVRVYGLSSILEVYATKESFTRPDDFDLGTFWTQWCSRQEKNRPSLTVTVRLSPILTDYLSLSLKDDLSGHIVHTEKSDADGYVRAELLFESFEEARRYILGLGNAIEVLEPEALRQSVIDYANRISDYYDTKPGKMHNS